MNTKWENYITKNSTYGYAAFEAYTKEYNPTLDKVFFLSSLTGNHEIAFLVNEIKALKEEIKKLKRKTKKVTVDE